MKYRLLILPVALFVSATSLGASDNNYLDLSIIKTNNVAISFSGDTVQCVLTVINNGLRAVTDAVAIDAPLAGLVLGTLQSTESATLTFDYEVN